MDRVIIVVVRRVLEAEHVGAFNLAGGGAIREILAVHSRTNPKTKSVSMQRNKHDNGLWELT